jgi:DoxX-like family
MKYFVIIAQVIVAMSIGYVWIFRFENIVKEFREYGLSNLTRTMVGSAKISLATLLIAGIWYADLVALPALLIALLMLSAQYFHFKVNNPWQKRIPSLLLMVLCIFITVVALQLV